MAKSIIVPGVHDLIPPQGRVTVQLTDPDRPWRVRKEVMAENAVMNWWLSGVKDDGFLGDFEDDTEIQYKTGFSLNGAATNATFSHKSWAAGKFNSIEGRWPGRYGNYIDHFWASSANVTPDADKPWIPTNDATGQITAWGNLDVAAAVDAVNYPERGTLVAAESWSTWEQSRMVLEWSTDQGNGTWRSAGIGQIIASTSGAGATPHPFCMYLRTPALRNVSQYNMVNARVGGVTTFGAGSTREITSMHHSDYDRLWSIDRDGQMACFDMSIWAAVYGITDTGLTDDRCYGIAWLNDRLWVVSNANANLYEYDDDLSALTLNSTIDMTANISGDTIYDITTDGTDLYVLGSSNVHKFDNTGTYQSSWAHGLTLEIYGNYHQHPGIEYDPAMDGLWVATGNNDRNATGSNVTTPWGGVYDSNDAAWGNGTERTHLFNLAGADQNRTWNPMWYISDDPYMQTSSITGMSPQGWHFWGTSGYYLNGQDNYAYNFSQGPSAASHAILPSDVIKTSSDALKVVYDFDFTP